MRRGDDASWSREGAEVYSFSRLVWRIASIDGGGSWRDRIGAVAAVPGAGS